MGEPAKRKPYPSDLTDEQWERLKPLVERKGGPGHPGTLDLREVLNALFYMLRTGCQWRYLPHDFPEESSVRYWKKKWTADGTWQRINEALRTELRTQAGRAAQPSAAILDSQTVKTTEAGGERGFDGGKKVTGRKRQLLVDTEGLLVGTLVHSADIQDREGGEWLLIEVAAHSPRLTKIFADQGYSGEFVTTARRLFGLEVEIVKKDRTQPGFAVLPQRWKVERSIAWTNRNRRLSKDYEHTPESSEAWIYLAFIHLMLKRLHPDKKVRTPYGPPLNPGIRRLRDDSLLCAA